MATDTDRERLVGKFLLDSQFRQAFLRDPVNMAASLGIELDEQEVAKLQDVEIDKKLDIVAKEFDQATREEPPISTVSWRVSAQ